jgi:hypothetical protein
MRERLSKRRLLAIGILLFWGRLIGVSLAAAAEPGSVPVVVRIRRQFGGAKKLDDVAPAPAVLGRRTANVPAWGDPPALSGDPPAEGGLGKLPEKEADPPPADFGPEAKAIKTFLPLLRRFGLGLVVLGSVGLLIWILSQMGAGRKSRKVRLRQMYPAGKGGGAA